MESALSPTKVEVIARSEKFFPPRGQLHFTHDIGIQKRADQESGQTGYSDAGRHAENEVEALLSFPKTELRASEWQAAPKLPP